MISFPADLFPKMSVENDLSLFLSISVHLKFNRTLNPATIPLNYQASAEPYFSFEEVQGR